MASEINKLKAKFESSNGGSPRAPSKPLPPPPKTSPEMKRAHLATGGSVKLKPTTPPLSAKPIAGKSDTLPSAKSQVGTPPTSKAEAASHLSFVLKGKVKLAEEDGAKEYRRSSQTRTNSVNGVSRPAAPPAKVQTRVTAKPKLPAKPLSPPAKEKPLVPASGSSGDVKSVFGVTLSHREKESAPHSPATAAKVKPLRPPPFRDSKPKSPSSVDSGGCGTGDGSEGGSRDERAASVPRDIELSGSEDPPITKKVAKTPPIKRLSVDNFDVKSRSTSDLSKTKDTGRQSYKPRPPPKKPGIHGDKPSLPPKPSAVSRSPSRSPSRAPPKPPIGSLKNTHDFSRARRGSSPSSRETTPTRDTPTPTGDEHKSRSKSFTPLDSSMEDTLKCPVQGSPAHLRSDMTNSWVIIDEPAGGKEASKTPPTKGSPLLSKRRLPPTPPRVKSPESTAVDSSKSPSVNALRSRFGDQSSSPPTSPSDKAVTPPKRVGENKFDSLREKFSSPSSGPAVVVHEVVSGGGNPHSSDGSVRSNADSGFISEAPDDLSSVGQATSNENVSVEMETPPTPLSPESHPEEEVEEVWDEARVSGL